MTTPSPFVVGEQEWIAHDDGAEWSLIDAGDRAPMDRIWASAGDDLWTLGLTAIDTGASRNVLWHYDGSEWAEVPLPEGAGPLALTGTSRGEPWLLADLYPDGDSFPHASLQRRSGDGWAEVVNLAAEDRLGEGAFMRSVCISDPDDVWVAGVRSPSTGDAGLLAHFDGARWDFQERLPSTSVAQCSGDEVWTGGVNGIARLRNDQWEHADVFYVDDFVQAGEEDFHEGQSSEVLLAPNWDDAWVIVRRSLENAEDVIRSRSELWHYDGCNFERLIPGEVADEAFQPRTLARSMDGTIWVIGADGALLRYQPD